MIKEKKKRTYEKYFKLFSKPRNPKRIPIVLKTLESVWKQQPDLRLGQLISIASRLINEHLDPFYIEDDKMMQGLDYLGVKLFELDKKIKQGTKKKKINIKNEAKK
jgi:hypothetical protein